MKLSNFFKKEQKTAPIKVQKLEKNQLEKVIGGGDGDISAPQVNGRMNYLTCWPSK